LQAGENAPGFAFNKANITWSLVNPEPLLKRPAISQSVSPSRTGP
jgi:hypothetical protein